MMATLPLDLPGLEKELGVRLPADYLDRIMFHPTLTIRGLSSGFVGAEANTIIPHRATVAIDIRMVKNQRWDKVYARVIDHIRAQGVESMEIWQRGDRLFMIVEAADDYPRSGAARVAQHENDRWEQLMTSFQRELPDSSPGEKWSPLRRIFVLAEHAGRAES